MKRIYRGRRYSTESAKECGSYGSLTLYKKRTGEFFICNFADGAIQPVTPEKALAFAKKYIDGYERFFKGSSAKKVTSFSLSADVIEKTKQLAVKLDLTSGQVIEEAIKQMYKQMM